MDELTTIENAKQYKDVLIELRREGWEFSSIETPEKYPCWLSVGYDKAIDSKTIEIRYQQ